MTEQRQKVCFVVIESEWLGSRIIANHSPFVIEADTFESAIETLKENGACVGLEVIEESKDAFRYRVPQPPQNIEIKVTGLMDNKPVKIIGSSIIDTDALKGMGGME